MSKRQYFIELLPYSGSYILSIPYSVIIPKSWMVRVLIDTPFTAEHSMVMYAQRSDQL